MRFDNGLCNSHSLKTRKCCVIPEAASRPARAIPPPHPSPAAASGNALASPRVSRKRTARLRPLASCSEMRACCRARTPCPRVSLCFGDTAVYAARGAREPAPCHADLHNHRRREAPAPGRGASGGRRPSPAGQPGRPARQVRGPTLLSSFRADGVWPGAGSGQARRRRCAAAGVPDCRLLPSGRPALLPRQRPGGPGPPRGTPRPRHLARRERAARRRFPPRGRHYFPGADPPRGRHYFPRSRILRADAAPAEGQSWRGARREVVFSAARPPRYSDTGRRHVKDAVETLWRGAACSPPLCGRLTGCGSSIFLVAVVATGTRRDLQGGFV